MLSNRFLSKYIHREPPFGALGLIVSYRTYHRFLPEEGRRERWWEVVRRVVEYSASLGQMDDGEEEELYDAIFNLRVFPAGRTLWIGGTPAIRRDGIANFNCAFKTIDSIEAFSESLYLLMNGCGVGFSVEQKHIDKLPTFLTTVDVVHKPYQPIPAAAQEQTELIELETKGVYKLIVGDSKEGWTDALYYLLFVLTSNWVKRVIIHYDYVRPAGTPLKTFGGRASGAEPLMKAFKSIVGIINSSTGRLNSVECMDIATTIAAAVVVGGVRRSSEIALGDSDDEAFITAKKDLFSDPEKARFRDNRVMSNNSVMLNSRPTAERFEEMLATIVNNGEPGLINAETARMRRPDFEGVNPCAEILLRDRGLCNLAEVPLSAHVNKVDGGYRLDEIQLRHSLILATRHCSRITNVEIKDRNWHQVQSEDRLLGVSLTGVMTAFDLLGIESDNVLLATCHHVVRQAADDYHKAMGIPRAKLATCIKPSGTMSLLPGVSAGIHRDYAPYYYRRIRVSKHDPVAKALTVLGFKPSPENGQGKDYFDNLLATINYKRDKGLPIKEEEDKYIEGVKSLERIGVYVPPEDPDSSAYLQWDICRTKVFTFAVKSNAKIASTQEPAISQLNRYRDSMIFWSEHNTSITVTFTPAEIPEIARWLVENWLFYVGIAFLPVFSPYPQMVYEEITEKQYLLWQTQHGKIEEDDFAALIASFETGEEWDVDSDCAKGGCPVR